MDSFAASVLWFLCCLIPQHVILLYSNITLLYRVLSTVERGFVTLACFRGFWGCGFFGSTCFHRRVASKRKVLT